MPKVCCYGCVARLHFPADWIHSTAHYKLAFTASAWFSQAGSASSLQLQQASQGRVVLLLALRPGAKHARHLQRLLLCKAIRGQGARGKGGWECCALLRRGGSAG